jgi:hypothetical protein
VQIQLLALTVSLAALICDALTVAFEHHRHYDLALLLELKPGLDSRESAGVGVDLKIRSSPRDR